MRLVFVAILTLVHEVAWLLYIRAVAGRRLLRAVTANGLILASGGGLTYCVATQPWDITVMATTGMLGTLLFWRFGR